MLYISSVNELFIKPSDSGTKDNIQKQLNYVTQNRKNKNKDGLSL